MVKLSDKCVLLNLQGSKTACNIMFTDLGDKWLFHLSDHGADTIVNLNTDVRILVDKNYAVAARIFFEKCIELIDKQ